MLSPRFRSRPVFNKGSKKPLNSEQGPREPKSVAKVWQDFELCKFFTEKSEKNRVFFRFYRHWGDLRHFLGALRTSKRATETRHKAIIPTQKNCDFSPPLSTLEGKLTATERLDTVMLSRSTSLYYIIICTRVRQ